ncbi:DoxX family protein [candidate division KSB1 bacterium]|nr:DoxX family protein [candidate division KSB1 bacterium]
MDEVKSNGLSKWQSTFLLVLRMAIGWHFLYEGISKLLIPNWTSAGYLQNSRWIFAGLFHAIAANETAILIVDWMNIIGLTLVGLALVTGLLTRPACIGGILLLGLYYIANPPFVGTDFGLPSEGHYLFVNKNLVEMIALLLITVFPAPKMAGLDRLILLLKTRKSESSQKKKLENNQPAIENMERREILKNLIHIPVLGVFGIGAAKKYQWESINAITGATIKVSDSSLKDLKGDLPKGRIGNFDVSRLIMGGNLIGGWAHARDLKYANQLFKSYNTEKKIFETLEIAVKAGINTMNTSGDQLIIINKFKRITGSKLQTYHQVHPTKDDLYGAINLAMDGGADMIQIQGNCTDWRVRDGEMDVLFKAIDRIREQGFQAGLGAHSVQALIACDKAGLEPDFYMKTLHHDQYWSAHPKENRIPFEVDGDRSMDHNKFHDNMFCLFPDESIEFMKKKNIPWIAFKVLAGGAIYPSDGFQFAFENGADFVCVGMFDWQIVDDVNITLDVLSKVQDRERAWIA